MKHNNSIFHQILSFLPRHRFQATVERHKGDHRVRSLSCWDQLVALLFAQMSGRQSLRDLVDTFYSKRAHHYHLGTHCINRSSLADANSKRPTAIYMETFFYLLDQVRGKLPKHDSADMVRLIDSSIIELNLNQFEWAKFRSTKAGIKLHAVYDPNTEVPVFFEMTAAKVNDRKALDSLPMMPNTTYVVDRAYNDYGWYYSLNQKNSKFIGRMKSNACYRVTATNEAIGDGILTDETIQLTSEKGRKGCPIPLRRVSFIRAKDQKSLVFITNDFKRTVIEVAALYKQRWEIELFFKWIKQNLKIKRFIGRSKNSVLIQVLVAMIAYLLLKLIQLNTHGPRSLQQVGRIISVNLTSRRLISELLSLSSGPPPAERSVSDQLILELAHA